MSGTAQPGPTSPPYPTSPYPPRPPVRNGAARALIAGGIVAVMLVAVLVVALLVLHSAGVVSPPPPHPPTYWDNVTGVNWYQSGSGTPALIDSAPGFSVVAGQQETLTVDVTYHGCFLFCGSTETVSSPAISTPGWTLLSANTPLAIPSGATGTVILVVEGVGGQSYTGVLSVTITLTS